MKGYSRIKLADPPNLTLAPSEVDNSSDYGHRK